MVIWEDSLLLDEVLNAVLDLVRGLLRLEVYQTASVLPVFQQMDDGVCRPLALIAGVLASGAARPAVFQRPRRGDLLLRQHTGNLGRAISRSEERRVGGMRRSSRPPMRFIQGKVGMKLDVIDTWTVRRVE